MLKDPKTRAGLVVEGEELAGRDEKVGARERLCDKADRESSAPYWRCLSRWFPGRIVRQVRRVL